MDGEQVEEKDGVGQHSCQLDQEKTCRHLHFCLFQGAAEDEEVCPGKEETGEERIANIFLVRENLVPIQVFPHAVNLEEGRNRQEDCEVDDKGNGQKEEGVEAEDDDGHGYRPNVEDSTCEKEGKESTECLEKLNLFPQGVLQLLATGCRMLLFFRYIVEGD